MYHAPEFLMSPGPCPGTAAFRQGGEIPWVQTSSKQENEAPRERLSRLSAASQHIGESLDMDSARRLTHAPYASIITLDAPGLVEDNLVLGLDPGDVERLWQAPRGGRSSNTWTPCRDR